jgi:hypothetical protein
MSHEINDNIDIIIDITYCKAGYPSYASITDEQLADETAARTSSFLDLGHPSYDKTIA